MYYINIVTNKLSKPDIIIVSPLDFYRVEMNADNGCVGERGSV